MPGFSPVPPRPLSGHAGPRPPAAASTRSKLTATRKVAAPYRPFPAAEVATITQDPPFPGEKQGKARPAPKTQFTLSAFAMPQPALETPASRSPLGIPAVPPLTPFSDAPRPATFKRLTIQRPISAAPLYQNSCFLTGLGLSPRRQSPRKEPLRTPTKAEPAFAQLVVEPRVHAAMNQVIANMHPTQHVAPGQTFSIAGDLKLKGTKYLWLDVDVDAIPDPDGDPVEYDVMAVCLDAQGQCPHRSYVVNPHNPKGALEVVLHRDTGRRGTQQTLRLNLYRARTLGVAAIAVVVSLRDARRREQSLQEMLGGLRCMLYDKFDQRRRHVLRFDVQMPAVRAARSTCAMEVCRFRFVPAGPVGERPQAAAGEDQALLDLLPGDEPDPSPSPLDQGEWTVEWAQQQFECTGDLETYRLYQGPRCPPQDALQLGETCALSDAVRLSLGFSWQPERLSSGEFVQLEIVAAYSGHHKDALTACGNIVGPRSTVGPGIYHMDTARTATHDDDSSDVETMHIQFAGVPELVDEILLIATVSDLHQRRGYTLRDVAGLRLRLYHTNSAGHQIDYCTFVVPEVWGVETVVEMGRITRLPETGGWGVFRPTAHGTVARTQEVVTHFNLGTWMARKDYSNVKVGDRVNITGCQPDLRTVLAQVRLAWDGSARRNGFEILVFCLGADEKIPNSRDFVHHSNTSNKQGTVHLTQLESGQPQDTEVCEVDLYGVRASVQQLVFCVALQSLKSGRQLKFANVSEVSLRFLNANDSSELLQLCLDPKSPDYRDKSIIEFGRLKRNYSRWIFHATGKGLNSRVEQVCRLYRRNFIQPGTVLNLSEEARQGTICFALGWDEAPSHAQPDSCPVDLDIMVLCLDKNGILLGPEHFIHYNNLAAPNRAIVHKGDAHMDLGLSGANAPGEDDEAMQVRLGALDYRVATLAFIVRVYEGHSRRQTLGDVQYLWFRAYMQSSRREIFRMELDGSTYKSCCSVEPGVLHRTAGNKWHFKATGGGATGEYHLQYLPDK
uniref:TerD domain-containing protein n=1 Tax=Eutreptiella gymnastica TaxID=73025 RepID=A0A7S1IZT0_9EUGL|mmetsp:Transcript_55343/g.98508  ORF Transcript_55343/g.98508 Transcript_55343/m.98508 type:complete len:1011 (+) Transcript_55343:86-3118(+)